MGILGRFLTTGAILSLALTGCQSEECKDKTCPREPDRPSDQLSASIQCSSPAGWDSVVVELHSGDRVETGALLHKWTLKAGASTPAMAVGEGHYSAKATYMRTGDTLDVYDSDDASWDSNKDECGCITGWSRNAAKLDVTAQ